ncbi:uncharacterized protein LOC116022552 isoform X2 [Ipomoea triloba]|uniref:uncharacterized protein LOC116022552 isoform X2 n=1 Tax=Ipomoea triloba TaxID=35885 RepID=UPI00125DECD4|nr:uncharacterized protein LOC116022552 isoform X2 [Ipomoea triloba]
MPSLIFCHVPPSSLHSKSDGSLFFLFPLSSLCSILPFFPPLLDTFGFRSQSHSQIHFLSIRHHNLPQTTHCFLPCDLRHNWNSENSVAMRERSNGLRNLASPDKGDKRGGAHNNNHTRGIHNNDNNQHHHHGGGGGSVSSETGHESKKGGSSSGSDAIPVVWPPKFVIALTNKEKEEDFMAIKGSKLPQRPKKRAKFIQRTLNLISPGAWLCDLSLERYEVREKKVSKKRPRGLKAMGNMDSDSE